MFNVRGTKRLEQATEPERLTQIGKAWRVDSEIALRLWPPNP